MVRLSVVVPCYNRGALIEQTLRSLVLQSLRPDEIIVVDDGSTDNSVEVVRAFGQGVRLICQENRGPGAARNTGFAESRGEFVLFMDSDDLLSSNSLELHISELEARNADISVSPWVKSHVSSDKVEPINQVFQQKGLPGQGPELAKSLLTYWSIVPQICCFRRVLFERVGGFPEDIYVAEDQELVLRCIVAGADICHVPNALLVYRQDNDGKTSELPRRRVDWARFLARARALCVQGGIGDPAQWLGYRLRVWGALKALESVPGQGELKDELRSVVTLPLGSLVYRAASQWVRYQNGLRARLGGGRAHWYFRSGGPTIKQRDALRDIGFSLDMGR